MKKGDILININIKNKDDIYEKYNNEIISNELISYILNQAKGERYNNKININLLTNFDLSLDEKESIINNLKNNFEMMKYEELIGNKSTKIKQLFLFLIGIIFIITSYVVKDNNSHMILSEIISIFGWVGIWEAFYSILFLDSERKSKLKRIKQLRNSNIRFI